jgi:hypothetical protein
MDAGFRVLRGDGARFGDEVFEKNVLGVRDGVALLEVCTVAVNVRREL